LSSREVVPPDGVVTECGIARSDPALLAAHARAAEAASTATITRRPVS
jgi:hypothetical protein